VWFKGEGRGGAAGHGATARCIIWAVMETNVLCYGDNPEILRGHIPDESIDLVYLDPPFKSKANYNVLFREESGERAAAVARFVARRSGEYHGDCTHRHLAMQRWYGKGLGAGANAIMKHPEWGNDMSDESREPLVGTIEALEPKTWGRVHFLLLCFTPTRVIVAKTLRYNSLPWSLLLGLASVILYPRARRKARQIAEQMSKMAVDSILAADRDNLVMAYDEIKSVQMKKPGAIRGSAIRITTNTARYDFGIERKEDFEAQCALLRPLVSEKLDVIEKL
jgi:hypothetical protein